MSTIEEQAAIDAEEKARRDELERAGETGGAGEGNGGDGDQDEPASDASSSGGGGDNGGGGGEDDETHPDEDAIARNADAEALLKKVSASADRYVQRLVALLGPDLGGYAGCAMCEGYPPGLVILDLVDDERRGNVLRQLGVDTFDALLEDTTRYVRCATCGGRGRVKTGSLKPGSEAADCGDCQGFGFKRTQPAPPPPAAPAPEMLPPLPEGSPTDRPPFDVFGTPSWHEDYGKMADMRTVPVSHWAGNLTTT